MTTTATEQVNQHAPTGKLRFADLYCGDGEATRAAIAADLDVVYAYATDIAMADLYALRFGLDPFVGRIKDSVECSPDFDLLAVQISGKDQEYPMQHAIPFIMKQQLRGVVFWKYGDYEDFGMEFAMMMKGNPELKEFSIDISRGDGMSFAVISDIHDRFPWPDTLSLDEVIGVFG